MGNLDQTLFAVTSCINNAKVLNNFSQAKKVDSFQKGENKILLPQLLWALSFFTFENGTTEGGGGKISTPASGFSSWFIFS